MTSKEDWMQNGRWIDPAFPPDKRPTRWPNRVNQTTQRNGYKDSGPHPLQDARSLAYQHGLDAHLSEEYMPGDGVAHLYIRDRGENARVFGGNLPPIRRHVLRHGESDPPEAFNNMDTGELHNVGGGESPHNRHWVTALHMAITDLGKTPNAELTSLYKNLSGEES